MLRLVALGALVGCGGTPEAVLDRPLGEADRQAARQFGIALASEDPPGVVCATHAEWLVHLVATTEDPLVAREAMTGLGGCAEVWHEPDVRRAIARWWEAPTEMVAQGLIAVTDPLVVAADPGDAIVVGLVRLAAGHAELGVRMAALESLDRRAWGREPMVATAFVDALLADRQPILTATVLHWLRFEAADVHFRERPRFQSASALALRDLDPGVRGRAALALARLAPGDPDVAALLRSRLTDEHPFARAAAAKAIADLGDPAVLADLLPLLDDHASTSWRSRPYTRLDGDSDRIRFVASPHERVDEAAMLAMQQLTADLDQPFVIRRIDPTWADLDLIAATRDAKAWYEAAYAEDSATDETPAPGGTD